MSYKGFSQVELRKPQRSTFDLSHEKRLSTRIGKLTPILCTEVLPNDTFRGSTEVLVKLAPLIAPIFHRLNLYVHFFFVPNRLLWKDWETFITGGRLGEAVTTPPVPPYINAGLVKATSPVDVFDKGNWADYMGIPPVITDPEDWDGVRIDVMPFAAMYQVFQDYYRDRNYTSDTSLGQKLLPLPSGEVNPINASTLMFRRYRCWEHDYFTSALPWTQRGAEVLMPIEGSGSVTYLPTSKVYQADGNPPAHGSYLATFAADTNLQLERTDTSTVYSQAHIENIDEVFVDASSISINDVRRAFRLQEWMERNALAGSRYNESIMAHFGRKTSDARLQRAEYLGGGKAVVEISEVMTTAYSQDSEAAVIPPANPSGRGSTYANTNSFSYNCEEHGFIIGVLSAMPTSAYMQGIPRMFFTRRTQLDYPWPSFAHLGEQEVYDAEIFLNPTNLPATGIGQTPPLFGYQSRYCDWKQIQSSSHSDFRTTLDFWHLTRKFEVTPELGATFVTFEDQLQDRIFNVSGEDTLWMYIYNKLTVNRSLPYFGTPTI